MDASLQPIVAALAERGDDELSALITTANSGPQTAPGLLAWIERAANWEQHRRLELAGSRGSPCTLTAVGEKYREIGEGLQCGASAHRRSSARSGPCRIAPQAEFEIGAMCHECAWVWLKAART